MRRFSWTCRESYLPSARVTFQRKSTICTSQKKFAPRTDQACCHTQLYASGINIQKIINTYYKDEYFFLQIRNTTISRINIYNTHIHILVCFFASIYPNCFTSKCCSSVQILQAVFPVFHFPPSRLVVHEGTNHMQPKGAMWLAALPPLDLGLDRMKRELPWYFFDHQRAYWFQEEWYVCFMFFLTNRRPSKEAGFVSKSTCFFSSKKTAAKLKTAVQSFHEHLR